MQSSIKYCFVNPRETNARKTSGEEILQTVRLIYSGLTLWALLAAPNQGHYRAVIWTPLSWGGQYDVSTMIKVDSQFAAVPVFLQMLRVSWVGWLVRLVARDVSLSKDPPSPFLGNCTGFALPLSPSHTWSLFLTCSRTLTHTQVTESTLD